MPSRDSVCGPRVGVKPIRLDCREKRAVGQDGGAPVLRASEPERAARGGASRAARVPGQVRGKQGEGQCAATPSSGAVRPGLIRSLTAWASGVRSFLGLPGGELAGMLSRGEGPAAGAWGVQPAVRVAS